MRRKDRERTEPAFYDEVFTSAEVIYVAFKNGYFPYCLPFNFGRDGERIYIHCAHEGLKLDCLRQDSRVAFSCAVDIVVDQARFATYFKSLCGTGKASIVEDMAEKQHALDCIGAHYDSGCPRPTPEATAKRVSVIRIDILSLHGKQCSPK